MQTLLMLDAMSRKWWSTREATVTCETFESPFVAFSLLSHRNMADHGVDNLVPLPNLASSLLQKLSLRRHTVYTNDQIHDETVIKIETYGC